MGISWLLIFFMILKQGFLYKISVEEVFNEFIIQRFSGPELYKNVPILNLLLEYTEKYKFAALFAIKSFHGNASLIVISLWYMK